MFALEHNTMIIKLSYFMKKVFLHFDNISSIMMSQYYNRKISNKIHMHVTDAGQSFVVYFFRIQAAVLLHTVNKKSAHLTIAERCTSTN